MKNTVTIMTLGILFCSASLSFAAPAGCDQEAAQRAARKACAASFGLDDENGGWKQLTPDQRQALRTCIVGKGITFEHSDAYKGCAASLGITLPAPGQRLDRESNEKIRQCIKASCGLN